MQSAEHAAGHSAGLAASTSGSHRSYLVGGWYSANRAQLWAALSLLEASRLSLLALFRSVD